MNDLAPISGVCRNPIVGMKAAAMVRVPIGVAIADTAPQAEGLLVCRLNGRWLSRLTDDQLDHVQAIKDSGQNPEPQLRAYAALALGWQRLTEPSDIIEWYDNPQSGSALRIVLTLAVLVASVWTGGAAGAAYFGITAGQAAIAGIAVAVVGNLLINAILPIRPVGQDGGGAPGSVYSASLAGNTARLDQPIWKLCGRVKVTPPYAANPYLKYLPSDPANPTVDCDQYYYVILALGVGNYSIEKSFIGKTPISHFEDVVTATYLPPGVQPTTVLANVVTSDEVANLELDEGAYVGGYAACRPGDTVTSFGVDIGAAQGLSGPVAWQVEVREINHFGAPVGEWQIVGTEGRDSETNTPQRWSTEYELPAPIRCEVRIVRTNEKNTDPSARDGIQWIGLRSTISRPAPLNEHTAHFEVVMRASQQLTSISQRDFSVIARAKVRTWNPDTGWSAEVFTRNAAWWLAELWTSPVWGEGLADDRIDLQGLYEWSLILDARQDHFDFAFTTAKDSWEAAQLIARSGRARAFRRNGVYSIARDELIDLPVTAFTPRNSQPKSMVMHTTLPKRDQPDGVIVEYQSNVTWDTATIECPCPGYSVSDPEDSRFSSDLPPMAAPVYVQLEGVTGAFHAEREGLYQAANMALRTSTVSAKVEMEGMLVTFMDPIRWQPQIRGYGQSGDVAFWDPETLVMGLSEPPDFTTQPALTLIRDDGSLTDPVPVGPGPTEWDITLSEAPDFDLVLDSGIRERPKFLLGPLETADELVKITSVSDGGKDGNAQMFDIEALVDDERVHTADNHLLPGPGDIQDPIDDGADVGSDSGGGFATLVRLTDHSIYGGEIGARTGFASFTLKADGTAAYETLGDYTGSGLPSLGGTYPNEWLSTSPVEPDVAAMYECTADDAGAFGFLNSQGATCTGPLNTWTPLSADVTWKIVANDAVDLTYTDQSTAILTVRIRRIGTGVVQATRSIVLSVKVNSGPQIG